MSEILHHVYDNGLVLVADPMPWLESAAFTFLTPAGAAFDPEDRPGLANLTCEMALRGCGSRDSRQFITDLDNLGVDHGESVSDLSTSYSGATLADALPHVLPIYADLLRRPLIPADQLGDAKNTVLLELQGIEDELQHKVMVELRKRHYPAPLGRLSQGTQESVETISLDDVRACWNSTYRPNGTILGVAGNIDWPALREQVGRLFGDWEARPEPPLVVRGDRVKAAHINHESNQTHVAVAYDSVPYSHPDFFQAGAAVSVLSGGMSSRLFTEVREKRGLCYTVYASQHTLHDRGSVQCYAGSRPERAQETLDVTLAELVRLREGVEPGEMDRVKAQFKTGVVMQQESSYSRSAAVARDWRYLGRARTLEEVLTLVDALSVESLGKFLAAHPPKDFTIVTLGPQELSLASAAV